MGERVIAVIGVGPRGLSVLERLLMRLRDTPPGGHDEVTIWAFDAVGHGGGRVWRVDQPSWLMANTTAGESTMRGPGDDGLPADRYGTMARWAGLEPGAYPARRLYGQYLAEVFRALCATAPPRVRVRPVRAEVTRMTRVPGGLRLVAGGTAYRVDKAVLATGHGSLEPDAEQLAWLRHADDHGLRYLPPGLAAEMPLDDLPPGAEVAVRGFGLTFYDVMRAVTLGRGGRFSPTPAGLRYLPSGDEPILLALSRGGLPFLARPEVPDFPAPPVRLRVVTEERLAELRATALAATGTPQLDFARLVEPLIQFEADLACSTGAAHPLTSLARPFRDRWFASPADYHAGLARLLRADARRAGAGCVDGTVKAATEMLRAIRPLLPQIVDFGGLLPHSHRDFLDRFVPESFVLSAGPPAAHVDQLAALMEAGIVRPVGPGARVEAVPGGFGVGSPQVGGSRRVTRVLVDARAPARDLSRDVSPLIRQLLADGMVSEFVNVDPATGARFDAGGLAVTRAPYRVIDALGRAAGDLHALGVATNHTRWFTEVGTGRPGQDSPFFRDADAVAAALLARP
ncbi:FAD/NAD(P)-binding protein [Nonomuraea gerenzanensis]|uniref:Nitrogen regulatory protein P-II n=1 Tax=Nonomuraea gerenzanensis TaxID=93944 RepID=A0A1M4EAR2_9ACTN|nr:FAD/NAD(P)-binding protein [Nonomuraea gerenzanensis]UBU18202.1 FAD/NAD(P)-binding protein [Nonomuraea gerenzanensis]SBO96017.1 Nitrogen regulatory protein P-II [Nonomuraea gerenzanensis]